MISSRERAILSWGYWFSALSLGLLLHPYMTLRRMVRDRLLRPLVALPAVSAGFLWMATLVMVRLGSLGLDVLGVGVPGGTTLVLAFLFWWVVWFLVLWQVVLAYLFVRFTVVLR
ncbi:MAG: hypothetical protein HYS86_05010 [Candidatus Chisholmbacteria bacterium]|nr:hypothetical protein [Candidatus Chisholmbacteria bacterium]